MDAGRHRAIWEVTSNILCGIASTFSDGKVEITPEMFNPFFEHIPAPKSVVSNAEAKKAIKEALGRG